MHYIAKTMLCTIIEILKFFLQKFEFFHFLINNLYWCQYIHHIQVYFLHNFTSIE